MDIRDGTTMSQEEKEQYAKIAARMREYTLAVIKDTDETIERLLEKRIAELKAEKLKERGKPEK